MTRVRSARRRLMGRGRPSVCDSLSPAQTQLGYTLFRSVPGLAAGRMSCARVSVPGPSAALAARPAPRSPKRPLDSLSG
jgi:hypothetical protein